ncbi:MAG: hypothetical protein PHI66_05280 [Candidatus Pacebacteria bacterium]|nr:hypothetical protein [Candidatus Paceibacterota bacterium]
MGEKKEKVRYAANDNKFVESIRRVLFIISIIFQFSFIFLSANHSYAADITWTGGTSTDWSTSTNWNTGTVPTLSDNIIISDASTTPNDPNISSGIVCNNMSVVELES